VSVRQPGAKRRYRSPVGPAPAARNRQPIFPCRPDPRQARPLPAANPETPAFPHAAQARPPYRPWCIQPSMPKTMLRGSCLAPVCSRDAWHREFDRKRRIGLLDRLAPDFAECVSEVLVLRFTDRSRLARLPFCPASLLERCPGAVRRLLLLFQDKAGQSQFAGI